MSWSCATVYQDYAYDNATPCKIRPGENATIAHLFLPPLSALGLSPSFCNEIFSDLSISEVSQSEHLYTVETALKSRKYHMHTWHR